MSADTQQESFSLFHFDMRRTLFDTMNNSAIIMDFIYKVHHKVIEDLTASKGLDVDLYHKVLRYTFHWTLQKDGIPSLMDAITKSPALTCHQKYILMYSCGNRFSYTAFLVHRLIEKLEAIPVSETNPDVLLDAYIECHHAQKYLIEHNLRDLYRSLFTRVRNMSSIMYNSITNDNGQLRISTKGQVQPLEYYKLTVYPNTKNE